MYVKEVYYFVVVIISFFLPDYVKMRVMFFKSMHLCIYIYLYVCVFVYVGLYVCPFRWYALQPKGFDGLYTCSIIRMVSVARVHRLYFFKVYFNFHLKTQTSLLQYLFLSFQLYQSGFLSFVFFIIFLLLILLLFFILFLFMQVSYPCKHITENKVLSYAYK